MKFMYLDADGSCAALPMFALDRVGEFFTLSCFCKPSVE